MRTRQFAGGWLPAVLAALLSTAVYGAETSRSELPGGDAQAQIDRMIAALGGRSAIDRLRSLAVEADCEGPGGAFQTRVDSLRPDATYFRQTSDEGSTEIWSTDDRTWTRHAETGVEELSPGVRSFVRDHEFHLLVLELETRFSGHEAGGSTSELGTACRRLHMEDSAGRPAAICIAESDGFPVVLEMNPEGAAGPLKIRFDDWKVIEGISYFHSFVLSEGTDRTFSYRYREIRPDSVPADRFVPPPAPALE